MFVPIEIYILKSREERRSHLNLAQDCIIIGGNDSREYRALLAHFLKTTIPTKIKPKIDLCHACNIAGCSNPYHLYWGTRSDNILDLKESGKYISRYQRMINIYGEEYAKHQQALAGSKGGKAKRCK